MKLTRKIKRVFATFKRSTVFVVPPTIVEYARVVLLIALCFGFMQQALALMVEKSKPKELPSAVLVRAGMPYEYAVIVEGAAFEFSIDPVSLGALCYIESGWEPGAKNYNKSGSWDAGFCQINNVTAGKMIWDVRENVRFAAKYLKEMLDKSYGDYSLAVGFYNVGPNSTVVMASHVGRWAKARYLILSGVNLKKEK